MVHFNTRCTFRLKTLQDVFIHLELLHQGCPNSVLEGRCPAEFSSSTNQTHLKQLIKVLLGILEASMQVC